MLAPLKIVVHLHGDLKQDSQEALSLQCYYNGGENTLRRSSFSLLSLSLFLSSFLPPPLFFIQCLARAESHYSPRVFLRALFRSEFDSFLERHFVS